MPISEIELLFSDLVQPHWDDFVCQVKALVQQQNVHPKVFISYAWPSTRYPGYEAEREIQPWLLGLYERLTGLGVTVLFDIKTMTLGTNIDQFMQQGVDSCDVVLIIGTQTYKTRSEENTNVKREVEHIQAKITQKGKNCVIPILYRGEFSNAIPNLGQILGTNCSDEFLYQENLPVLIESLFQLQANASYQTLKQNYLAQLKSIKDNGLSEATVQIFTVTRIQKAFSELVAQREAVSALMVNFKNHPEHASFSPDKPVLKMQFLRNHLENEYKSRGNVQALFGKPMALDEQYINVQMLYQVIEEKKISKRQKRK